MTATRNSEISQLGDHELDQVTGAGSTRGGLFEIEDYSFDIEQVLSIGSQSSGAGAGKVTSTRSG